MKLNRKFLHVALCFACLSGAAWSAEDMQLPARQVTSAGVEYLAGGIGEGAQIAFENQRKYFNLQLTFAGKGGGYAADISVKVVNASNQAEVLNLVVPGPFLFTNLPAGQYKATATYSGETASAKLSVKSNSPTKYVFYFAVE